MLYFVMITQGQGYGAGKASVYKIKGGNLTISA